MLRSRLGTRRLLRLVPLIGLLASQAGYAQSYYGSPAINQVQGRAQSDPLAVVGDSDDHRGRVLRGNLARIYLANGLQIIAPPEKDLVQLRGDVNSCRYGSGSNFDTYIMCLHNRDDTLQSPNGVIFPGANEGTRPNLTPEQEEQMWKGVLCPICKAMR